MKNDKNMKNRTKISKALEIMMALEFLGIEKENYGPMVKQAGSQDALLALLEKELTGKN